MHFLFSSNDTATTSYSTLSLHDALPILLRPRHRERPQDPADLGRGPPGCGRGARRKASGRAAFDGQPSARAVLPGRSEEHTSELQSHVNLVCRLLLEKKKTTKNKYTYPQ